MAEIAILGYGNVGRGVGNVILKNAEIINQKSGEPISVKYVFDKRSAPGDPYEKYITNDAEQIFNDKEVSVIVEALGGTEPAYTFAKRALSGGKSYVTSNKELVAAHGAELHKIAKDNNKCFLFEASVGGGVPIIRPMSDCLTAENVSEIFGIMNGTTNYILTRMEEDGVSFSDALADAQKTGYAESNPDADVNGFDAARKIAILLSMTVGRVIDYRDIPTEGIVGISPEDLSFAKKAGYSIKLIASAIKNDKGFSARVAPMLVSKAKPLSAVSGVLNGICVRGNAVGELMFTGAGAGSIQTASAVVADVIDSVRRPYFNPNLSWEAERYTLAGDENIPFKKLVVLKQEESGKDRLVEVHDIYEPEVIIHSESAPDICALITKPLNEAEFREKEEVAKSRGVGVLSQIRIMI